MDEQTAKLIWRAAFDAGRAYGQSSTCPSQHAIQVKCDRAYKRFMAELVAKKALLIRTFRDPVTGLPVLRDF